jgi:hypothetical protein
MLGLPVGGIPARLVGELILDRVDRSLIEAGRSHVRRMDDMAVGVTDERDGADVVRMVADITESLGLTINKSKTKVRPSKRETVSGNPVEEVRMLLRQDAPDRVGLVRGLRDLKDLIPTWEGRKKTRWMRLLVEAAVRVPAGLSAILRTMDALVPGSERLDDHVGLLTPLLRSPVTLHRAETARFLSRHGAPVIQELLRLVIVDSSALVRREALLGLVRLGAQAEVAGLLRGEPREELDRGAWVVSAGVYGREWPFRQDDLYERLLYKAAREHLPRDV